MRAHKVILFIAALLVLALATPVLASDDYSSKTKVLVERISEGELEVLKEDIARDTLREMDVADLRALKRLVFASYGQIFKTRQYHRHFSELVWYPKRAVPEEISTDTFEKTLKPSFTAKGKRLFVKHYDYRSGVFNVQTNLGPDAMESLVNAFQRSAYKYEVPLAELSKKHREMIEYIETIQSERLVNALFVEVLFLILGVIVWQLFWRLTKYKKPEALSIGAVAFLLANIVYINLTDVRIPLGEWIESALNWLTETLSVVTKAFAAIVGEGLGGLETGLMFFQPWVLMLIFGVLAWFIAARKTSGLNVNAIRLGALTFIGLMFAYNLGLWEPTISTISLVLVATFISVIIGIPLGILAALNKRFYKVVFPILDFMQTMPAFVYLIPAIPFFGLGKVSAAFATVIFSMPPAIRLTTLGILQIPEDLIEAADAFGSNRWQKLIKVQIPLSVPTIMAGVNQTIMLSLSMVVIASMIGAKGLGGEVWRAIQRMKPGMGFEAGLGVVIVAMILDRITQKMAQKKGASK